MLRLEVIDFVDPTGQAVVARVPEFGTAAFRSGAQLIVQQSQEAVFFRGGRALDKFGPGRYTLSTENIPLLSDLLTIPWEKSPFQACVYFVGKQQFVGQGWGTRHPLTMRDPDFGMIRLRGFGRYAFRVEDSSLFLGEIVGTAGRVTTTQVSDFLRDKVVSGLADLLATTQIGLLQLAGKFVELEAAARVQIGEQFRRWGLELTDFTINNISPPQEVQEAIDARSSMAALGDLRSFTLYKTAHGVGSQSSAGGVAAAASGAAIGSALAPMLHDALAGRQTPATAAAPAESPEGPDFTQLSGRSSGATSARDMLKEVANSADWKLEDQADEWKLTVPVGPLRTQQIQVSFDSADEAGHPVVRLWSSCGSQAINRPELLLEYNAQLVHGAFAIQQSGAAPAKRELVLRANLLADTLDKLELARSISSIAWQADRFEQQVYEIDEL